MRSDRSLRHRAASRKHIREMYGPGVQARQILIARRLVERGVRFVQVWHGEGQPWDSHDDLDVNHRRLAQECDQAIGALLKDLKQRGLLDETLVIWGGEFGRTPTVELPKKGSNAGKINGRDHNHYGFTMWLAGGGVQGRLRPRRDRRIRLQGGRKAGPRSRPARHDPAPAGLRPRKVHLPLRRPRLPPDRRAWTCCAGVDCIVGQCCRSCSSDETQIESRCGVRIHAIGVLDRPLYPFIRARCARGATRPGK